MPDNSSLLTPRDVAKRFGITTGHVARLARTGELPFQLTPGKQRRFRLADVEQLERALAEAAS